MWKRCLIMAVALVAAVTSGYAYYVNQLHAIPYNGAKEYTAVEPSERTQSPSFLIGGIEWAIVAVDSNKGTGLISPYSVGVGSLCPSYNKNNNSVSRSNAEACIAEASAHYSGPTSGDDMAYMILSLNQGNAQLNQLQMPTLSQYDQYSKIDPDFFVNTPHTWLDDRGPNGEGLLYTTINMSSRLTRYMPGTYDHLWLVPNQTMVVTFTTYAEITLPQKGIIKAISSSLTNVSKSYTDRWNEKDAIISNIDTTSGEGPYNFYVYDTDASGNGNYKNASQYFELTNTDSTNGKTDIKLKDKLPVGDYYFKVKVVDESMNNRLYYDPGQFENDPYRSKETDVMHVTITKVNPTIAFDIPTQTKKSMTDAATSWNETATAT
ncbi:MAG: hypothetical protein HFE68_06005, partial [Erysipelotrichaceae bacterium]|nr:hypothetical protein [Erysipelotrichaceae bacterium]